MNKIITLGLLAILIPATHISHLFLNSIYNNNPVKTDMVFNLPDPEIMKVAAIGYDNFLADMLWLQLLQYTGDGMTMKLHPETYSLVNTITTLDPYFKDAYIYGAYYLTDNKELGRAISILDRGNKYNPNEWYIPYEAGFLYYINGKKNKVAAARYLNKAGDIPGSPPINKQLAALLLSDTATDLEIKINLWQQVYDRAKKSGDKPDMERAYKKLVEFKVEADIENIKRAIKKYNDKYKAQKSQETNVDDTISTKQPHITADTTPAKSLRELKTLVDQGYLKKLPIDPFARPYMFDEKTQEVRSFPFPWESGEQAK